MKNIILLSGIVAGFLLSCTGRPSAEKAKVGDAREVAESAGSIYSLEGSENHVQWIGNKPGGQHHGTVNISEGQISVSGNEIKSGSFVIDLNSIKNNDLKDPGMNAKLVGHLKSRDFFYTEEFPEARFEIVGLKTVSDELSFKEGEILPNTEVTGNLTIRGITKSLTFPARINIEEETVTVKTNPFAINRTLWEVNHMSKTVFAEITDKFVDDNIILQFDLRFNN